MYSPAHFFCLVALIAVFVCGLFFDNSVLMYVKPLSSLALIFLYFEHRAKINPIYLLLVGVIMVNDALIYDGFDKNFLYISILLSFYYVLCFYMLRPYLFYKELKLSEILKLPIFIAVLLVVYLTISILQLVLPFLEESLYSIASIVITLFLFLSICFLIYSQNRFTHSYFLLITACSAIFVNALVPIQELYYTQPIFPATSNAVDFISMFFYLKFLIHAAPNPFLPDQKKYL